MFFWSSHEVEEKENYTPPPPKREERIVAISKELNMWRAFKESCVPKRWVHESFDYYPGRRPYGSSLDCEMTDETVALWRDFAQRNMEICERRLRAEICGQ